MDIEQLKSKLQGLQLQSAELEKQQDAMDIRQKEENRVLDVKINDVKFETKSVEAEIKKLEKSSKKA